MKFLGLSVILAMGFQLAGEGFWKFRCKVSPKMFAWGFALLLLGSQVLFARAAWQTLGGQIPWGYDHPSFMFRVTELVEVFPRALGGYSPHWNAGIEHFVGVTSGTHGYAILNLPLLLVMDAHRFYGAALIFWFVFAFPWLGVASLSAAKIGAAGAFCGGMLLCGASRGVIIWMWHFGTVGAMTSAMMVVPVMALSHRILVSKRGGWGTVIALGLATWLMCLWTPGFFIAGGLGLGWLCNYQIWTWRDNRRLVVAGILALLLLSPWIWHTMFPCRNVIEYVGTNVGTVTERPPVSDKIMRGANRLWITFGEWHPVALILGGFGAAFCLPRETRRLTLPVLLTLGAIAGWYIEWKPLSQLERMAIPMAVVGIFPAAMMCARLFAMSERGAPPENAAVGLRRKALAGTLALNLARGVVLATFFLGFRVVRMHYANEGVAPIRLMPEEIATFMERIRQEVPEDGRLGFAGPAVHAYGGGKIAHFPIMTGREMMADDYYGFPSGTIEFNYPPLAYRRSLEGYLYFSRAYGITHWTTTHPAAMEFFSAHPDEFERIDAFELLGRDIELHRLRNPGPVSRFLEGGGRVEAAENRLQVWPDDPDAEQVVLRYNWREGLYTQTPGATIQPHDVDENLRFIAVQPGGNEKVDIRYRPRWAPVEPNFDGTFHH
ncbi:MAG: hypothetical protein JJU29_11065 [Verrucomicrobia bacterium]|nr:hypothetical protein [Verrucomicrobiota bacterium]MCH8510578.1 hypothetical protein [Kiritimatiellia bacterium]